LSASLLETVQGLLTRTYALTATLEDIGRYVVGDEGLRRFYTSVPHEVRSPDGSGARLLVRERDGAVSASIYYPDAMIRALEEHPPQRGLGDANVDAFAVLVEELDHLLVTAERADAGRAISMLELELHANVSKYLVLGRFLAGRGRRLDDRGRIWLRHHLFHKRVYEDDDPSVRRRYDEAARLALRFLDGHRALPPEARVAALRRFHRAPLAVKLENPAGD
jgi:hypothetical protein